MKYRQRHRAVPYTSPCNFVSCSNESIFWICADPLLCSTVPGRRSLFLPKVEEHQGEKEKVGGVLATYCYPATEAVRCSDPRSSLLPDLQIASGAPLPCRSSFRSSKCVHTTDHGAMVEQPSLPVVAVRPMGTCSMHHPHLPSFVQYAARRRHGYTPVTICLCTVTIFLVWSKNAEVICNY